MQSGLPHEPTIGGRSIFDLSHDALEFAIIPFLDYSTLRSLCSTSVYFRDLEERIYAAYVHSLQSNHERARKHFLELRASSESVRQSVPVEDDRLLSLDEGLISILQKGIKQQPLALKRAENLISRGAECLELASVAGHGIADYIAKLLNFSGSVRFAYLKAPHSHSRFPDLYSQLCKRLIWLQLLGGLNPNEAKTTHEYWVRTLTEVFQILLPQFVTSMIHSSSFIFEKNRFIQFFDIMIDIFRMLRAGGYVFDKSLLMAVLAVNKKPEIRCFGRVEDGRYRDHYADCSGILDKSLPMWKEMQIRLVLFLVNETNCDPFGPFSDPIVLKYLHMSSYFYTAHHSPAEVAFLRGHFHLLDALNFNPIRILRRGNKEEVQMLRVSLIKIFSSPMSRSSVQIRKKLIVLLEIVRIRDWIMEEIPFILFEYVRAKERKLLSSFVQFYGETLGELVEPDSCNSLLHVACMTRGRTERIVRMLLERCGCDVNARNREGKTPLMYARQNSIVEILESYSQSLN